MKTRLTLLAATIVFGAFSLPVPARAADPVIPVIVKDTTSFYWQIVLAGARKAGQDLHVKVPELGATSEADINGRSPFWRTQSPTSPPPSSSPQRSSQPSASRSTRRQNP